MRLEDALLIACRQSGKQRQHFSAVQTGLLQLVRGLANMLLTRQKDEGVGPPAPLAVEFAHGFDDTFGQRKVCRVFIVAHQGPVAHLHRVAAAGHLDHRRSVEKRREFARIDRGRSDDHPQIGAAGRQSLDDPQQQVDVQAALVCLIDDQGVVASQGAVALEFLQQDPVGHQFDPGVRTRVVVEAHLVADRATHRSAHLLRETAGQGTGGDSSGLGMSDDPGGAPPGFQAELG